MRFVIAALQCATMCSLELPLQRRRMLQSLAVGAAAAAAPAHAGGVVSDEVSVTFKEASLGMQLDGLAYQKTTLGSMPSLDNGHIPPCGVHRCGACWPSPHATTHACTH